MKRHRTRSSKSPRPTRSPRPQCRHSARRADRGGHFLSPNRSPSLTGHDIMEPQTNSSATLRSGSVRGWGILKNSIARDSFSLPNRPSIREVLRYAAWYIRTRKSFSFEQPRLVYTDLQALCFVYHLVHTKMQPQCYLDYAKSMPGGRGYPSTHAPIERSARIRRLLETSRSSLEPRKGAAQ